MKVDKPFIEAMRQATQLIRTQGPRAATRFIQGLFRAGQPFPPAARSSDRAGDLTTPIEDVVEPSAKEPSAKAEPSARAEPVAKAEPRAPETPFELPRAAGQFLSKHFSSDAGSRNYKLYVPSSYADSPAPLLVMLHGCTQDPDDFALGTRANRWAEMRRCLVVYPEQVQRANAQRCWNWFRPENQHAGRGEPAIIAGITRQVIGEYRTDTRRLYVAGLSAGGAMAAIVGQAYPELFAAIGVHSGLPVGAAHSVPSALAVMKFGRSHGASVAHSNRSAVPLIVLHGDADRIVNPDNASRLIELAIASQESGAPLRTVEQTIDAAEGNHAYRRIQHVAPDGTSMIEEWRLRGAGHAWSGGDAAGTHTDARGPDATKVMLDFFDQHVLAETATAATL